VAARDSPGACEPEGGCRLARGCAVLTPLDAPDALETPHPVAYSRTRLLVSRRADRVPSAGADTRARGEERAPLPRGERADPRGRRALLRRPHALRLLLRVRGLRVHGAADAGAARLRGRARAPGALRRAARARAARR